MAMLNATPICLSIWGVCDLAIIAVKAHGATPLQKVLKGDKAIEGYLAGGGKFYLNDKEYVVPGDMSTFEVRAGDTMQWHADEQGLLFFEICYPPYADGRFENVGA